MQRDLTSSISRPARPAAIVRLTAENRARVEALPSPGPFEGRAESGGTYPSEMARAFATTILVMYPVMATLAVVLVSLFLTGGSHSA